MARKSRRKQKSVERSRRLIALAPTPWWEDELNADPPRLDNFPPPADGAPMKRCASDRHESCGRFYPGYYVKACGPQQDCQCEDCHNAFLLAEEERRQLDERRRADGSLVEEDPSTLTDEALAPLTAIAELLFEMKACGLVLTPPALPSEDEADLRAEIEHFKTTGQVAVPADWETGKP